MKDKSDFRTRLIAATLQDDWAEGPAAVFALQAAAATRRRRARRHLLLGVGGGAGLATALFLWVARPALPPPASHLTDRPLHHYDILTDDQLLAQVRDRGLLAIREPDGSRRIIILAASGPAR